MSAKPGTLARWAETTLGVASGNITTPLTSEQDSGWTVGQTPVSSGKMNWLFFWIYQWLLFLNDSPSFSPTSTNTPGLSGTGNGTGAGGAFTGGASGPGVAAVAGGGGAPVRGALNLASQTTPITPSDGDMWYDGTVFNARAGGVTKSIGLSADGTTLQLVAGVLSVKNGGIGTTQLASGAVTSGIIANGAVGTTQLADTGVTRAKLAAVGQQISSSCATFTTSSTTAVDVTNLSVSLTTTGRPVVVALVPNSSGSAGFSMSASGGTNFSGTLSVVVDGTTLGTYVVGFAGTGSTAFTLTVPAHAMFVLAGLSAAAHTIKFQASVNTGVATFGISNAVLVAYEL